MVCCIVSVLLKRRTLEIQSYRVFIGVFVFSLAGSDCSSQSSPADLHDLPCLALRVHNCDIVLDLGVGIVSCAFTADKVHLGMV